MASCPSCGESRWVYPREHVLGPLTRLLAGWEPAKCKSCTWRGWSPVAANPGVLPLLYDYGYRQAASLYEQSAILVRRLPPVPRLTRPGIATGLFAAVAIGLVAAGVRFSAQRSAPEPHTPPPTVQPPAPESPRVEPLVEAPSTVPVTLPAAADERIARPADAVRAAPRRDADRVRATASSEPPLSYRGSLVITSDPPGALVTIDGQVIGTTPLVLNDVRAGSRVVRIESNGYERWSAAARVVADRETKLNATLQRGSQP